MIIKTIPHKKYLELFDKLKAHIKPNIVTHPYMTQEEHFEALEKAFNPPVPLYIDYYEVDGLVRYVSDELKSD